MKSSVTLNDPADLSINKLQPSDRAFHDWYRFVLSYPPHLVRHYFQQFDLSEQDTVLDPFCGTGTTLVEAKKNGLQSVGIEAIPMSQFACQTKVQWRFNLAALAPAKHQVLAFADAAPNRPQLGFTPEQTAVIVKNSIADGPLHQCLVLKQAIASQPDGAIKKLFNLALAYVAVHDASNLKFGPEVGIRRTKRTDAPVFKCWSEKVDQMAADLTQYEALQDTPSKCFRGDARTVRSHLSPQSISAVITSPPYPNEKDYTRTTRLESVLLDFIQNKADLKAFKQSLIRSNTRNVYKVDDDDQLLAPTSQVAELAQQIENRRLELQKTSGFERLYHRVTSLYFGGMKRHLLDLRTVLKPGAQLAYVVGDQASFFRIMIRTGELLEEIAAEAGYVVRDRELFRTRLATATGEQLREEVLLLEWRGTNAHRQFF